MTVDFTLPPPDRLLVAPPRGEQIAVPLHILADVPLTGVDLVSEDGCPLPLLTTAEAADLSISGIASILAVLAVRARVDHLLDGEAIAREVGAIVGRDKTRRGEALGAADDPSTAFGAALASSTPLRALLRDLSHSTLTLVPLAYEPDRRRVVKIAWDWPFYWRRHADTRPTPYPLTPESERARRTGAVLAFLGWSDTPLAIGDLPFGWARSTHVELGAPADVELHSACLTLSQRDPATCACTDA
ncbi:hypothetical protein [Conexibacter arvalis]|uniref:Uncharacterized protein n=1 Tax=Conexibacter arvalis TaxID=912552 RepID=A0A840IIW9_9ACTN|nr:hypothetical protein [Conexibacter arvalis]MBB4664932.1 hypothetical protein [Conexibacter arvalis]